MLHKIEPKTNKESMRKDVFIAKAECKWHAGQETLPHSLDQIPQEQINKILESADKYPTLNRKFIENIDLVTIEPNEIALDKNKITKEPTSNGETHEVFEGELFFVIKVPSSFKMDSEELLENINVLLRVSSKFSSTKLIAIEYLGTNTYEF